MFENQKERGYLVCCVLYGGVLSPISMSGNVYLFGAGISAGTVPMVSETPDYLERMIGELTITRSHLGDESMGLQVDVAQSLADSIIDFAQGFHADITNPDFPITQDEWAKRLLRQNEQKFHQLREFLSIFYTWSQRTRPTSPRILRWIEDLFDVDSRRLPPHSTVLTWNYDWQLEAAVNEVTTGRKALDPNPVFGGFFRKADVRIEDKGLEQLSSYKVFKLNGDAFWSHPIMSGSSEKTIGHASRDLSPTQFWNGLLNGLRVLKESTSPELRNGISFAFHWSEQTNRFFEVICSIIKPANNLVVAGYSFPDTNQQLDARLLSAMVGLKTITIYDLPEKEQSLRDKLNFLLANSLAVEPKIHFIKAGLGQFDRLPISRVYQR